jgi:hypothetical protein
VPLQQDFSSCLTHEHLCVKLFAAQKRKRAPLPELVRRAGDSINNLAVHMML